MIFLFHNHTQHIYWQWLIDLFSYASLLNNHECDNIWYLVYTYMSLNITQCKGIHIHNTKEFMYTNANVERGEKWQREQIDARWEKKDRWEWRERKHMRREICYMRYLDVIGERREWYVRERKSVTEVSEEIEVRIRWLRSQDQLCSPWRPICARLVI